MKRVILLAALAPLASAEFCKDDHDSCVDWASIGECAKNPTFMRSGCKKACFLECGGVGINYDGTGTPGKAGQAADPKAREGHQPKPSVPPNQGGPKQEPWELEDLTQPYPKTAITDLDGKGLNKYAVEVDKPVFTWFYAPWCKQCKLVRPAVETTAQNLALDDSVTFAKLDCVADVEAKKHYGVTAYPSFKVLRGNRHRWVEMGRNRSIDILTAAVKKEALGPLEWIESAEQLKTALFEQVPDGVDRMDAVGRGEALALGVLSSKTGPAATALINLASGCSARLSPLPFAAITDPSLLAAAGLPDIPVDHVAVVKLFTEPYGAPDDERAVPRLNYAPLVPEAAVEEDTVTEVMSEEAMCTWALGHRLPLLIDFDEDPYWGKRAGTLGFVKLHLLLFLSPAHVELAGLVRAAAARFKRGEVIVMQFMLQATSMEAMGKDGRADNPMFKRYGVNTVLDTPRLVVLDQRIDAKDGNVNRQRVFPTTITEQAVLDFIKQPMPGLPPLLEIGENAPKDEL